MLTFQNDDAIYRQWISDHSAGFVVNVPYHAASTPSVLHTATCSSIKAFASKNSTTGDYYKVWGMNRDELVKWANQQGKFQECKVCKPLSAPPISVATSAQSTLQRQGVQPKTSAVDDVVVPVNADASAQSGHPPYIVQRSNDTNTVEAWSVSPLPFEFHKVKRPWLADFKKELIGAIDGLKGEPNRVLHTVYGGPTAGTDIENLLIYNVDPGHLAPLTRYGLRFEMLSSSIPLPQPRSETYPCYYRYAFADVTDNADDGRNFVSWQPGRTLARWTNLPAPPLNTSTKLHPIWYAVRTGHLDILHMPVQAPTRFGFDISIGLPANTKASKTSVSNIVKPLLDGLISAFHAHNGKNLDYVSNWLATTLPTEAAKVKLLLQEPERAVLGTRQLLWKHGMGIQWNPADDRCLAADIRLVPHESSKWLLSGRLFELDELDAPSSLPGGGA